MERLSAKLADARKEHDDAKIWLNQLEADLKAVEGAKKWAEENLGHKEIELASVK